MLEKPFIHETAVVDDGATIGLGTKIWHFSHVSENAILGANCILGQNVYIASGVRLGQNCKVQNNVSIYTGVRCESDVFLGPSMVFTNVMNPRSAINRKSKFKETLVRQGASIGANATIVCGNEIGSFALVAAGSVVTRDVKPYELVMGVPAIHKGWVSAYGNRLDFSTSKRAKCIESGTDYELVDGTIKVL